MGKIYYVFRTSIMQKIQYCVTPPESDEEFVACMEEVLEVHHRPRVPENPVVAMDKQPILLLGETRPIISARPACDGHTVHAERVDYEYEPVCKMALLVLSTLIAVTCPLYQTR